MVKVLQLVRTSSVVFTDERVIANAGLMLFSGLVERYALPNLIRARFTGFRSDRKFLSVLYTMLVGGSCIDDARLLGSGSTRAVLGDSVMSPESIGQWLRSVDYADLDAMDTIREHTLKHAWREPGHTFPKDFLILDIDSSICEVYGKTKEGASASYTGVHRAYHPVFITRSDTREVIAAYLHPGSANSGLYAATYLKKAIDTVRRCGYKGRILVRGDSAYYAQETFTMLNNLGVFYIIAAKTTAMAKESIQNIRKWTPLTRQTGASIGETMMPGNHYKRLVCRRFIPRSEIDTARLFDNYFHHALVTNLPNDIYESFTMLQIDSWYCKRARQELVIKELKQNALKHFPSASFTANEAWLLIACLAHNLTQIMNYATHTQTRFTQKTLRMKLISIPARITRHARKTQIIMPKNWPHQHHFNRLIQFLRTPLLQPK